MNTIILTQDAKDNITPPTPYTSIIAAVVNALMKPLRKSINAVTMGPNLINAEIIIKTNRIE